MHKKIKQKQNNKKNFQTGMYKNTKWAYMYRAANWGYFFRITKWLIS